MKESYYDNWGTINEPESFIELVSLITQHLKPGINVNYWRGQADISWLLESSMVRKIKLTENNKEKSGEALDKSIFFWEEILLNEAKKNLYNYDDHGRKLSDIELLAKLQHYGAATRLLDFSKNALIALWFCVSDNKNSDKTGILIGIDTDIVVGMENKFDFDETYSHFVKQINESESIWMVDSPAIVSRISSQHSVFLCCKCGIERYGSFTLPYNDIYKKVIAISPALKKESERILSECFNITPFTIYPDIEGFANAYSSKWENAKFTRW